MVRLALRFLTHVCLIAVFVAACESPDRTITQQQRKLESLGASVRTIGEYWLDRRVAATYARTALEQMHAQVEQQRSILASEPRVLQDTRGADLSARANRLSTLIAQLLRDVQTSDGVALRQHLSQIPLLPESR